MVETAFLCNFSLRTAHFCTRGAQKYTLSAQRILAAAVLLICGKGGRLLAGYNTMTPEERAAFDERALCRFWGKILLPMGAFLPMAAVGGIYDKVWPALAYLALVLGLVAFAIIYSNTGKRFRK